MSEAEVTGPQRVETLASLREAYLQAVRESRHRVDVLSRDLDPSILGRPAFSDALRALVLSHRRARVRVLARDTASAARTGHALIELARRLSSFIEIRRLGPEDRELNEAYLIADGVMTVHRSRSDRPEAEVTNNRAVAHDLSTRFDELWARAELDPELRRLHL